jgi:putative membrane protein
MEILQLLNTGWSFEPWVLIFASLLVGAYILGAGAGLNRYSVLFYSGVLVMLFAIVSPLDFLGRYYLFSAHMIQHILLLLIAPLLMLLGIPKETAEKLLKVKPIGGIMRVLGNPVIAWFLGVGAMWVWHMPSLHDKVLNNESLYIAQLLSFIFIGMIFWWPVFAPVESRRLNPLTGTLYLASACLGCTILGMLITFASAGLYTAYVNPADTAGLLAFIRNDLCITPGMDQQIGGLTMWVPGCLIYLTASMITIAQWYGAPEEGVSAVGQEAV